MSALVRGFAIAPFAQGRSAYSLKPPLRTLASPAVAVNRRIATYLFRYNPGRIAPRIASASSGTPTNSRIRSTHTSGARTSAG